MLPSKKKPAALRRWAVVLACLAAVAEAGAGELYGVELRKQDDIVRLLLESEAGTVREAGFTEDGRALVVDLTGVSVADVQKLLAGLAPDHPLIRGLRVLPLGDKGADGSRLVVDLRWSADVLDETIASVGKQRSRWEIVLSRHRPAPGVLDGLAGLEVDESADGPVLVVKGDAKLKPGVRLLDKPPRLLLDLPGVDAQDAAQVAGQFQPDHPLVQSVTAEPDPKGSRLVIALSSPVRLGPSKSQPIEGGTALRVALQPLGNSPVALGARFDSLDISESQGQLNLVLAGASGYRSEVIRTEDPPRLTVRLQGVDVKRLGELVNGYRSTHPDVVGVRMARAGKRSADLVVDLARPLALAQQPAAAQAGRLQVALVVPAVAAPAAPAAPVVAAAPPAAPVAAPAPAAVPAPAAGPAPTALAAVTEPAAAPLKVRPLTMATQPAERQPQPPAAGGAMVGLLQAYDLALENDPKYKAAQAEYRTNLESVPQARAGYLPTASFDFQRSRNQLDVLSGPVAYQLGKQNYTGHASTLTITQPILKVPAYVKLQQSKVSVEQSKLALLAAEQDLMVRLATGYLTVLAGQDGLELARAEREATGKQFELARARLEGGLGTMAQLRETEARFALTEAREIEAQNKLDDARSALREIIGADVAGLQPFAGDIEPVMPQPAQADSWVSAALEQNLSLQARQLTAEIAALEIKRQQATYLPTLNLVASRTNQEAGGSLYGPGSRTNTGELSIRLSVPLFEGGMTNSLVREAQARNERALAERDQEYRKVERQARASLLSVVSTARTLAALKKSVQAQEAALASKQEGLRSGLQTIVAVVDAYRLYYAAKRDYLQARYDHLLSRLRLKQAVGTLSRGDVDDIAQLLKN